MVDIAKNWINTPFLQGGITKYGCDCIGLIIGILLEKNINIKPSEYFELGNYNHLNIEFAIKTMGKYFETIPKNKIQVGDIIMLDGPKNTAHFAIVSSMSPFSIIHAHQTVGKVVETISEAIFSKKITFGLRYNHL